MKKTATKSALLEIGTEEIPARFIDPALDQLRSLTEAKLKEEGLSYSKIETWGTPRRLVLLIEGLLDKTPDRTDVAVGPPPKAAKDANGNWTQAAIGFAKAQKISVERLECQQTPKGERFVALHPVKGQKTEAALKNIFPELIQKLNFPKTMIWEESQFRFARPIRWIVALFQSKVIRFHLAGVNSDRNTWGLFALGNRKIPVPSPTRYKDILKNRCILVDGAERKEKIVKDLEATSKKIKPGVKAIAPEEHLQEVVNITEYPVAIRGEIPNDYLALPPEILVNVLRKHQKFFPLQSSSGKLINAFIGFRNGPSDHQAGVQEGYERVTNARLADAQFFFDQDKAIPLEKWAEKLDGVGYLQGLGTLKDKTKRIQALAESLADRLEISSESKKIISRSAALCKADLVTQMVGELPEVQGLAGRYYATAQGEPEVGEAIEDHYKPLSADGDLPKNENGAIVGVADKLDSIAANFSVGNIPSGSQDPFALRRVAIGAIRIILNRSWGLSLRDITDLAFSNLPEPQASDTKSQKDFLDFLYQRVLNWLTHQGYRPDEVDTVFSNTLEPLPVAVEKLKSLKKVRGRTEFASLSSALKRAANILRQANEKGVLPASPPEFQSAQLGDPERNLLSALDVAKPKVGAALTSQNFHEAFLELAPLKEPVDAFFEGVMVMVDDANLRAQRLSILNQVKNLFDSVADFSKLQTAESSSN